MRGECLGVAGCMIAVEVVNGLSNGYLVKHRSINRLTCKFCLSYWREG